MSENHYLADDDAPCLVCKNKFPDNSRYCFTKPTKSTYLRDIGVSTYFRYKLNLLTGILAFEHVEAFICSKNDRIGRVMKDPWDGDYAYAIHDFKYGEWVYHDCKVSMDCETAISELKKHMLSDKVDFYPLCLECYQAEAPKEEK